MLINVMTRSSWRILLAVVTVSLFGDVIAADDQHAEFVAPRSILVLPPINNTTKPLATYSYLSTVSEPLVRAGYYVYPVALIDNFLKENGLPTPNEMHSISLSKIEEIIGADAVLYITLDRYGQEYQVLRSQTVVSASARLIDVSSGAEIWAGQVRESQSTGSSSSLTGALVNAIADQIINSSVDAARPLSRNANYRLFLGRKGIPRGLLHPCSRKSC